MPSIRYGTGFRVAIQRNQSVSIRSRGMFIDERKSSTKKTGKIPCTASGEPLRSREGHPDRAHRHRAQRRQHEQHRASEPAGVEVRTHAIPPLK